MKKKLPITNHLYKVSKSSAFRMSVYLQYVLGVFIYSWITETGTNISPLHITCFKGCNNLNSYKWIVPQNYYLKLPR